MKPLLSLSTLVASAVLGGAVLLGGSWLIVQQGIDRLLERSATLQAEEWTGYLASNIPDLGRVVDWGVISDDQRAFLKRAQQAGNVYRWKFYDRHGLLTFDSKFLGDIAAQRPVLPDRNLFEGADGARLAAMGDGWPKTLAHRGDGAGTRSLFAHAIDEVTIDGEHVGYIEVHVDQTQRSAEIGAAFTASAVKLLGLATLGFLLPLGAVAIQARRKVEVEDKLSDATRRDRLTGLMNRTAFVDFLGRRMVPDGVPLAVLFVDLKRFKDFNEIAGHEAGDTLLQMIANRLNSLAPDGLPVARLGGDEFALVIEEDDRNKLEAFAERTLAAVAEPVSLSGSPTEVEASIGIAQTGRHGRTPGDVIKAAEMALGEAKSSGTCDIVVFSTATEARRARRLTIEVLLREAIDNGEFTLLYQPTYRVGDRSLAGFEALLRLTDQDGETVSPGEFIPVAEETGLIVPLGRQVLSRACRTAVGWERELIVAVNMSAVQFAQDDVIACVEEALETSGLPARQLELELTESLLMRDPDRTAMQIDALRGLGVSLALDDFGTGYSSLGYLWRFSFDKLKIDRSFVQGIEASDERSRQILRTVTALGEVMKMSVTAEGVETAEQDAMLGSMKIDYVQGFLYGRPQPAEALDGLIAAGAVVIEGGRAQQAPLDRSA